MAEAPRSSFIPKQISGTTPVTVRRKRVFSVMNFISGVFLIGAILAAGGVFFYNSYLERTLALQRDALNEEYRKFDEGEIASVKAFDQQLKLAGHLLDRHASPSSLLDALEVNTKASVQYTSFDYERRPSGGITLNITGTTDEFGKLSLQWMAYLRDQVLADATLTQIGLEDQAVASDNVLSSPQKQVRFALLANFDASDIAYTPPSGGTTSRVGTFGSTVSETDGFSLTGSSSTTESTADTSVQEQTSDPFNVDSSGAVDSTQDVNGL